MRGIFAEDIYEEAQECVPKNKMRHDAAGDGFGMFPENQQQRDQEKVFNSVVENDRMPESLGIGKLHRPGDGGMLPTICPSIKLPMRPTPIKNAPGMTNSSAILRKLNRCRRQKAQVPTTAPRRMPCVHMPPSQSAGICKGCLPYQAHS